MSKTIKLRPFQQAFLDRMVYDRNLANKLNDDRVTRLPFHTDITASITSTAQILADVMSSVIDDYYQRSIWAAWRNVDNIMSRGELNDVQRWRLSNCVSSIEKLDSFRKAIK